MLILSKLWHGEAKLTSHSSCKKPPATPRAGQGGGDAEELEQEAALLGRDSAGFGGGE